MRSVLVKLIRYFDYWLFCLLLFSLPFGKKVFIPVLFSWIVFVIVSYIVKRDYSINRFKIGFLLPILFFLFHTLGFFTSSNDGGVFRDLEVKLTFILLPLLYPLNRSEYQDRSALLSFFVWGCVAAITFYLGFALYKSVTVVDGNWSFSPYNPEYPGINYFRYSNLSFLIHPSYLALYFIFALFSIVFYAKHWIRNKSFVVFRYFVWGIAFFFLTLGLILLESRAGVLSLFIFIMAYSAYQVIFKHRYVRSFLIVGLVILPLVFSVSRLGRLSGTVDSLMNGLKYGVDIQSKDDPTLVRLWIWRTAFDVIKENPILGVGNGDARDVLKKKYLEREMYAAATVGLNAHNQYLESWLALGILGGLGFFILLGYSMWVAIKGKDWILLSFILFFMSANLFESMLETVTGVTYFTSLYVLLCCSKSDIDV